MYVANPTIGRWNAMLKKKSMHQRNCGKTIATACVLIRNFEFFHIPMSVTINATSQNQRKL